MKKVDDNMLVDIHAAIKENEKLLTLEEHMTALHALEDNMAIAKAEYLNYEKEHQYREAIVKKLDALVAVEEAAVAAIRSRMVATVKAKVVETFEKDKAVKEAALEQAVAVLAAGGKGKLGKDVVGAAYVSALKNYRETYAKLPAGSDEILVKLERDIAAISAAPVLDFTGGNVYEGAGSVAAKH